MKNIKQLGLFLLLFHCVVISYAKEPIILQDKNVVSLVDSSSFIQLDSIGPGKFKPVPNIFKKAYFYNHDTEKSYWYTFTVINQDSVDKEWLLVSYNYTIDEIDLLVYPESGIMEKQIFRDTMSIYMRELQHKQPVFKLQFKPQEAKTFYVRIKNDSPYQYVFAIYSHQKFFSHFFREYLLFGLFYGLMLFILLYSIMYFIFLNDKVILIYTFFITSQILYMLFRDGNGLFLMPDYTEYADLVKNICLAGLSVFVLLYTVYFLKIPKNSVWYKVFIILIVLRIIYTIFYYERATFVTFHLELIVILFCSFHSIRSYIKGFPDAKYMSIGFSMLSIAYVIYYLTLVGISPSNFGFFALYYGMALESIFMTMALTERFKRMRLDNYRTEQMNKELEELVATRTELLKQQSEELNLFLYSASHDLKGPLKSIKGLCNIGLKDKKLEPEKVYEMILNRLKRLELNINDLNAVTNIKNADSKKMPINFEDLHQEMLQLFHELSGYKEMNFEFKSDPKLNYESDSFAIRCIYQNIFENAIKYRDPSKKSFLKITITQSSEAVKIVFEDNGQGIKKEHLPFIFDMFYRANEDSKEDTGLGLYIVKLALNKLGGKVIVESLPTIGTSITVILPGIESQLNQNINDLTTVMKAE